MSSWFRSLRFRLQLWNALILVVVILGFGGVLRWQMHRLQWEQIDGELLASARIIEGSLRGAPPGVIDSLAQDLGFPPGPLQPPPVPKNAKKRPPRPKDDPPRIHLPDEDKRLKRPTDAAVDWGLFESPEFAALADTEWEAQLRIPRRFPQPIGRDDEPTYFVVWRSDASILDQANLPESQPARIELGDPRFSRERYIVAQRSQYREVFVRGPRSTMICVGRAVDEEERRAHRRDGLLFATGGSVLLLGLLGSWWLSRKATQPIEAMTRTAAAIGPKNLRQRMDLAHVDRELAQLGTVLNSMLDRLDASFHRQQQFTADASHELRTPLTVMLTTTEHALSKDRTPDEYREHLEACRRSAQRMRQLVESLLDLARLDAQPNAESMTDCDLESLVSEQVSLLVPLAGRKHVALHTQLEPATVRGDPMQLARLVTNLVQNAIDYNRPEGSIRVELQRVGDTIELRVIDTGVGIAASDLPHLFDRFYRVDEARSRQTGGTGLGLSICQAIATAHQASIEVQSELGVGSKFVVKFLGAASSAPSAKAGDDAITLDVTKSKRELLNS